MLLLLLTSSPAVAAGFEEASAQQPSRRFRLNFGTGITLGLSDVEEWGSDTVGVGGSFYHLNLSLAPSWQVAHAWALGARASWASDAGSRGTDTRSLWQLGAEARLQPRGLLGPYLAATLGLAGAEDRVGSASALQWAPALGGAAGYDFDLASPVALGLELRGGRQLAARVARR
jgi:hypothetical protein